ncbi:MAG: cobalamin-binding protein, partial [Clostridia bacterium]|nr:cobalamin-binding protein [Clostridia bacterium]
MNNYLMKFNGIIESENREKSLAFIKELLEERKLSVMEVYEKVLTPSLNSMEGTGNEEMDIWKEHIRTSIVRTIIENMYPYVIRERDEKYGVKSGKKVAVI